MKLHKTATHCTLVELRPAPANGRTESEPPCDDVSIQASTIAAAKQSGIDEGFVRLIKEICLLALRGFNPGDIVDSTMLCAEIRYGQRKDKPVDDADVPGLDKPERLDAGTVVLLMAYTEEHPGELPLKSLGRNSANLQQYRVM